MLGIKNDEELTNLTDNINFEILGGGVIPNINNFLIKSKKSGKKSKISSRKKSKRSSRKKSTSSKRSRRRRSKKSKRSSRRSKKSRRSSKRR